MKKVFEAVDRFKSGYACSQAILSVYGESLGLDHEKAVKIAAGFAGGMGCGAACGAVTAAFMVLGLRYGTSQCQVPEDRGKVIEKVKEFAARFEKRNKSIVCNNLLDCDISTAEGLKTAREQDLFNTVCPKIVQDAAEIIEEMIN